SILLARWRSLRSLPSRVMPAKLSCPLRLSRFRSLLVTLPAIRSRLHLVIPNHPSWEGQPGSSATCERTPLSPRKGNSFGTETRKKPPASRGRGWPTKKEKDHEH